MPETPQPLRIGVLAIQGGFAAHGETLRALGVEPLFVRKPEELANLDGLIIPGGESTTFLKALERGNFLESLHTFAQQTPAFGTCAGAILLAKEVLHPAQKSLSLLDVTIERNAYGRQNDSIIEFTDTRLPGGPIEMVYIRAPRITRAGESVRVLASREGAPVLVQQGHLLAATFHPELSSGTRVHEHFLQMVKAHKQT